MFDRFDSRSMTNKFLILFELDYKMAVAESYTAVYATVTAQYYFVSNTANHGPWLGKRIARTFIPISSITDRPPVDAVLTGAWGQAQSSWHGAPEPVLPA